MTDFCCSDDSIDEMSERSTIEDSRPKVESGEDYLDRLRPQMISWLDLGILGLAAAVFLTAVVADWSFRDPSVARARIARPILMAAPMPPTDRCDRIGVADDPSCE